MHAVAKFALAFSLLLLAPGLTSAQDSSEQRIVLAPVSSLSGGNSKELAAIEKVVEAGLAALPAFTLIAASEASSASRRAKRPELRSCEGDVSCLSELGKLLSASHCVYAEVGGLGDAQVVYLKLVNVQTAREVRSTTLELLGDDSANLKSAAAATRLVTPDRFVGQLQITTSLPGAMVFLDGHKIATTPSPPIPIYVGSHALRVTHPERSDYVRWVDIEFGATTAIAADLQPLPALQQRLSLEGNIAAPADASSVRYRPTPWYYRWYTISGGAAVIFVGSAILLSTYGDDIDADLTKRL